jgi:enoyl-CoA hydratase
MIEALLAWKSDPAIAFILIDHSGERGFCAGGDIRMLAQSGQGDGAEAKAFFFTEYRLNHLLMTYGKPVVVIMDGVTMGGGVGIAMPASHRVATERTNFAMPETGIGLFPDVGGGWFLPRLPEPELGTWLALTGARLKGADAFAAGIATHLISSEQVAALKTALITDGLDALKSYQSPRPAVPVPGGLQALFGHDTVEAIVAALEADGSDWALAQLASLKTKSPQTLKVALRQLRAGAAMSDFADNMRMEYRIGARVVTRHDFIEGVRAVIIDKDNAPKWKPDTLEGVSDALLDEIFAPLPADQEWSPHPNA